MKPLFERLKEMIFKNTDRKPRSFFSGGCEESSANKEEEDEE